MDARWLNWILLCACLAACSGLPPVPYSRPPVLDVEPSLALLIDEPMADEVVVVVNNNIKMVHAGMFAGPVLLDPAGSYLEVRRGQKAWAGVSLQDYLRFQLEDGPDVKVYRFRLSSESFTRIKSRLEMAGRTFPLFCAAKVQNIISGIPPFESVPSAWLITPIGVGHYLDRIVERKAGLCHWADGSSCYAQQLP